MNTQPLSIMTWNIYFGASFAPLFTSPPEEIPARVTDVFRQFLATDLPTRAKAIARIICNTSPDIIGLQEAAKWTLTIPHSTIIEYGFIKILLRELEKLGMYYRIVAQNKNSSNSLLSSNNTIISFEDRDFILARECSNLCIFNSQSANFTTNSIVQIGGQPFTVKQGWSYIDAKFQKFQFRLVNTHLDALSPTVRLIQLNELLATPGDTTLPLFFIGDFNSNSTTNDILYQNLLSNGFQDAFGIAGRGNGFTCCQNSDLLNASSTLNTRIDWITFKNANNLTVNCAYVVGDTQQERTCTGLWPSDHASVVAHFEIH